MNKKWMLSGVALLVVVAGIGLNKHNGAAAPSIAPMASVTNRPALTVRTTSLRNDQWTRALAANGSIVAWQEAIIGAETSGVRIIEVRVSVGDVVKKGQVLATLARDSAQANTAEAQATLKESEAMLAEASANAERMRKLRDVGFISEQQADQASNNEKAARARMEAQRARLQASAVRLGQLQIVAPDAGIISARNASVGTLTQPNMELFRLIRQGRLEWQADLTAAELGGIKPGMKVTLTTPQGQPMRGQVRAVAPSINMQTRYGQVLVDVPANSGLLAGMFVSGTIQLGEQAAIVSVLPQSAVAMRNGTAFVYVLDDKSQVHERVVTLGQRHGDQIEILTGLAQGVPVVETGAAFLVEGDTVRVVNQAARPSASSAASLVSVSAVAAQ